MKRTHSLFNEALDSWTIQHPDRLITAAEVCSLRGRGNTDLFLAIKSGKFPEGARLGPRTVRWSLRTVLAAIETELAQAKAEAAQRTTAARGSSAPGVAARRAKRAALAAAAISGATRLASCKSDAAAAEVERTLDGDAARSEVAGDWNNQLQGGV